MKSENKKAKTEPFDSHEEKMYLLEAAQKIASLGYWKLDQRNKTLIWSDQIYHIFGFDPRSVTADFNLFLSRIHPDDREQVSHEFTRHIETGTPYDIVHRIILPDDSIKYLHEKCETTRDAEGNAIVSIGTVLDVSERKNAEKTLQEILAQKEVLVQELYHRTRNNMQLIISMLHLFSSEKSAEIHYRSLEKTERWINLMAIAHEKLMETNDLFGLSLRSYFVDLLSYIQLGSDDRKRIRIESELEDLKTTIDVAIPCGIILGELVLNAIQHGTRAPGGVVTVSLTTLASGEHLLSVSDEGPGLPDGWIIEKSDGQGLKIAHLLTESQLQGSIELSSDHGLTCTVVFRR